MADNERDMNAQMSKIKHKNSSLTYELTRQRPGENIFTQLMIKNLA